MSFSFPSVHCPLQKRVVMLMWFSAMTSYISLAYKSEQNRIVLCLLTNHLSALKALKIEPHILQGCIDVQRSPNLKINPKNAKWSHSRFRCMWAFWFPQTKSLDGFSATWNMTRHLLFCTCALLSQPSSIWPLLSPDTQIPFPRPGAVFVATITLLLFLRGMGWRWWAITARADFLPQILTGYSTIDRIRFVGPIANSCKLTIWRQQLWAMKGLKIRREST